jgi:hypothetical protein
MVQPVVQSEVWIRTQSRQRGAVALNEAGETGRALGVLEEAHGRDPYDRDILVALVTFNRDHGNASAARAARVGGRPMSEVHSRS